MNPKHFKNILFIYALFIISALVHFHILLNEIINWRDDELFFALHTIANGAGTIFSQGEHSPAMMLWYGMQFSIGGDGHFIYHAISILLHTANALMLFILLLRFGASSVMAMTVALLFTVHPIHVESIAMITNQQTVLSMLMLQFMVFVYSNYLEGGKRFFLIVSIIIALLLQLIGNPAAYVIVALILLRTAKQEMVSLRSLSPFLFILIGGVIGAVWNTHFLSYGWSLISESVLMFRFGFIDQAFRTFLPWMSSLLVDSVSQYNQDQGILAMIFPLIALVVCTVAILLRNHFRIIFYGVMIILFGSLPLFTGVSRGDWAFAEDGAYLASAGWIVIIVWAFEKILISVKERKLLIETSEKSHRNVVFQKFLIKAIYGIGSIVLLVFSVQTAVKASYWENGYTYWGQCLEEKPENVFVLLKKGMYHYFRYEIDPALKAIDAAIVLAPNDYEVHYSRGVVNLSAMLLPAATVDFTKALALDPTSSNAYFGLGSIHSLYSRFDSAVIAYTEAIRYAPNFFEAYTNRATVYGSMGKFVQSYADFGKAQQLAPQFAQLYGNRALISLQAGNAQAAFSDFATQIAIEPHQVPQRINAALTAILLSDTTTALLQFSKAYEIDSLRTKLYLSSTFSTFLKSKQELDLGNAVLKKVIGK